MTVLKWLLVLAVVGYGGVLALMYVFQRRLMYFPDATRVSPAQAGLPQADEITLTSSDGEKLVAWFVPPRGDKPIALYFQGNAEGLPARAGRFTWLTADGTGLLALCYRGYGGSSGTPSEQGLIGDAEAAYAFARARFPAKRIVLFGESLGTAVAVALAAGHEVAGVILDAPFTSAADVGAAAYPFVPVRWAMKDTFHSDRRIGHVTAPLLVLHGEQDVVVPIRFGEKLFALAREPKRFVRFPRGNHVDLDDHGAAKPIKEFLAELP
ncbi:MAG TPA: alpha/beta hydrolase [Pseudolabrys sp.]|nr:alpha/beta hydrolase [Pseudolabrys sp.]